MKEELPPAYKGVKEPGLLFDLVCARNWFAGNLNQNIPVDESRQVFREIKRLIISQEKDSSQDTV